MPDITVKLPDGSEKQVAEGSTVSMSPRPSARGSRRRRSPARSTARSST